MIAEILPDCCDISGRRVFRPDSHRHGGFRPTFPMGRYLSQPLTVHCANLIELRRFLSKCSYVSDEKQFGKSDYWLPPDEFEKTKKGDCEDFALWTWRQFLDMGYDARFVVGSSGRYGEGHAWVTFNRDGKSFLVEPLACMIGTRLPRLSAVRYQPHFSVAWDGHDVSYYEHTNRQFRASLPQIASLAAEWLFFWTRFWMVLPVRIAKRLLRKGSRAPISPPS